MISILFYIFTNGMAGSLTLTISYSIIVIEYIFLGQLDDFEIYLSGKENSILIYNLLYSSIVYFNCGLLMCVGRGRGVNDYESIQHYIKIHYWFLKIFSLIIITVICLYGFAVGWIYDDAEKLKWTRIELAITCPISILFIYVDSYRNIYIALDQKCFAVFFECTA